MGSWRDVIPADAYRTFSHSGQPRIPGERPALIVVDVVLAFLGRNGLSLDESIKEHPLSCGPAGWRALPRIRELVEMARSRGFPVIFTTGDPASRRSLGGATKAVADQTVPDLSVAQIPDLIAPTDAELTIAKSRPSAFFGTPLASVLVAHGVDDLIICGCTTSGCVRATVVDGHSFGWPVIVAEDACFDRASLSHDVSLFEMNAKYASVLPVDELAGHYLGQGRRGR